MLDSRQRYVVALSGSIRRAQARATASPSDTFWSSALENLLSLLDEVMGMSPNDGRFQAGNPGALRAPWEEMVRRAQEADPSARSFGEAVINQAAANGDTSYLDGVVVFALSKNVRTRGPRTRSVGGEHPHQVGHLIEFVPRP